MCAVLLKPTPAGLYCEAGDFYVDPWQPVDRAIITHAHSDHARPGSRRYLAADSGRSLLELRLGPDSELTVQPIGQPVTVNGVRVTFFPAGHILGSTQVRIEKSGHRVVVSGDYKRQADPTCRPFEPVACDLFVTESTFGLPIYRWPDPRQVASEIDQWWRENQAAGKASLLLAYALGKAQRLLALLDPATGPIFTHGAVEKVNTVYRERGVGLPATEPVAAAAADTDWSRALIVAPPSAAGTPWVRRFGLLSTAMASGWMQIRGTRRRRAVDRGFVLSDHVDWPDLLRSIKETGAGEVWVTHGYSDVVTRYLQEQGVEARPVETEFVGESVDDSAPEASDG